MNDDRIKNDIMKSFKDECDYINRIDVPDYQTSAKFKSGISKILNKAEKKPTRNKLANDLLHKNQVNENKSSRKEEVVLKPQYFSPDSPKSGRPFKKVMIAVAAVVCVVAAGIFIRVSNKPRTIDKINSANEHLNVEVSLPTEAVTELPKINVKIMEWNEDQIKNVLLSGKENLVHEEHICEPFPDEKQHVYHTEEAAEGDESYLIGYQPGQLLSRSSGSGVFGYGTLRTYLGNAHLEDIFTDDNISLLSKGDAIERCTDILKAVGITNYTNPTVYAVTVDKANTFWEEELYTDVEEYKAWSSAEEEVYIMRFPLNYGDINATTSNINYCANYGLVGNFVGSYVDFVVTKDGIHSLEARNIFSPGYEIGDTVKINCSAENALKIAAEQYDNMSIDGLNYKIYDCKLVYVPHDQDEKNFTLVPMWEIEAACYRDDDTIGTYDNLFIDAETGNIIIW